MTLSAPPEQTLRVPRDRPGDPPSRRVALIAGIFMVVTFISIPALPLYDQVLNHASFIVGGGGDTRVELGALFEILTLIGGIGMAVTLYPVLRRQSPEMDHERRQATDLGEQREAVLAPARRQGPHRVAGAGE